METGSKSALAPAELNASLATVLAERGEKRLEALLDSSNPKEVTSALVSAEVFFTFAQLEEEGQQALIKLLDDEQILYLLDLDLWNKDRLDEEQALEWLERLNSDSVERTAQWFMAAEQELVVSLLQALCIVSEGPTSSDDSLTEATDRLLPFTAEGVYYVQFKSEKAATLLRGPFLILAGEHMETYFTMMQSVQSGIPSVTEEKAYKQRWLRLRDEGFIPPDEAYELYRWPRADELSLLESKRDDISDVVVPTALALSEPQGLLAASIARIDAEARRKLSHAIAVTSTHVLSADHLAYSDIDDHKRALEKTLGYVTIGLQHLSEGDPLLSGELLANQSTKALFRQGFARVANLGRRATVLRRQGWLSQIGLGHEVLDEPLGEVVTALAKPRPLYPSHVLDGEKHDREFRDIAEIDRCAQLLSEAEVMKRLFIDGLGLDLAPAEAFDLTGCHPAAPAELTLGLIFRTALSVWLLNGQLAFSPIETTALPDLIVRVRDLESNPHISELQDRLQDRLDEPTEMELIHLEQLLEINLGTLSTALAAIDLSQPVDPRFIGAIVIKDV